MNAAEGAGRAFCWGAFVYGFCRKGACMGQRGWLFRAVWGDIFWALAGDGAEMKICVGHGSGMGYGCYPSEWQCVVSCFGAIHEMPFLIRFWGQKQKISVKMASR